MKVKHKFSGGFLIIFLIAFIILNCFLGKAFINYHENKIKNEMDSLYKSSYSILRLYFQVNNLEGNKGNLIDIFLKYQMILVNRENVKLMFLMKI